MKSEAYELGSSEDKQFRKSPRFPHAASLRMSPRFPAEVAEGSVNSGVIVVVNLEKSSLRRSPRLNSSWDTRNVVLWLTDRNAGKKARARKSSGATNHAISVRNSPRYSPVEEDTVKPGGIVLYENENYKIDVPGKSPMKSPNFNLNSATMRTDQFRGSLVFFITLECNFVNN